MDFETKMRLSTTLISLVVVASISGLCLAADNSVFLSARVMPKPIANYTNCSFSSQANQTLVVDLRDNMSLVMEMFFNHTTNNYCVNVTEHKSAGGSMTLEPLNKFFDINIDDENLVWVFVKVYYTDSQINSLGLDESSLRLHYYNETSGDWSVVANSGVNTIDNFAWANLTHFSLYGVFGSKVAPATTHRRYGSTGGITIVCGDGFCTKAIESCSSCPEDCGVCPATFQEKNETQPTPPTPVSNQTTEEKKTGTPPTSPTSFITGLVTAAKGNAALIFIILIIVVFAFCFKKMKK